MADFDYTDILYSFAAPPPSSLSVSFSYFGLYRYYYSEKRNLKYKKVIAA